MGEKSDKLSGHAKEAAGDLTGDEDLQREGKVDRTSGDLKGKLDEAKHRISGLADKAKRAVSSKR